MIDKSKKNTGVIKSDTLTTVVQDLLNANKDERLQIDIVARKEKNQTPKFDKDFVFVFQDFLKLSAQYEFKQKATYQLLIAIMGYANYGNYFGLDLIDIAKTINHSKRTVMRAIQELVDLQVLFVHENPNDKRRNDYSINPNAIWKGRSEDRNEVVKTITRNNPNQLKLMFDENN